MSNGPIPHSGLVLGTPSLTKSCPSGYLEYLWYLYLFYWMLGPVWGIEIPVVGGMIWMLLPVACFLEMGNKVFQVSMPVVWGVCTGVVTIGMQVLFYTWDGTIARREIVEFAYWISLLITVQVLSQRAGFLKRFALVATAIGIACLPYIQIRRVDGVMRAWAAGTLISTPNVLGMWFGFSTVYFVFEGFQSQRVVSRVANWSAAVGCFYVVLIAVSRAPLLAVVLACLVGFRSALKTSFVPLLAFVMFFYIVYIVGVFDEWLDYFFVRGTEDTGRGMLWPAALERISNSPWVGFGLDHVAIHARSGRLVNPHNPILHLMLAVGILPVICFLGYLRKALVGAVRLMQSGQREETTLLPPLVVFALLEVMNLDLAFMLPWVVVVFGLAAQAAHRVSHERPIAPA